MNGNDSITPLHLKFIELLEHLYGSFDKEKNKFESTSNSKIARDLFYSDSQFSRLINGTASEGEFKRAIRNVERSLELRNYKSAEGPAPAVQTKTGQPVFLWILTFLFAAATMYLAYVYFSAENTSTVEVAETDTRYEMLQWSYENKYINPYVKLRELPDDCYYPCYKYQGRWSLKKQYKIPFFRERNGFHYVAREATMYSNCLVADRNEEGEAFEGYEYQKHEIWYDKREMPIDSFLVTAGSTKIRPEYTNAELEEDDNFVKIAYVHTFFRGEYTIDSSGVHRSGKVIGRDIEFVPEETLQASLSSEELMGELIDEVNAIAQNRLEDFSKPISCNPAKLPREDFHQISEGDELNFSCQFSTGRFLVDYNKSYELDYQYITNVCR
ncbi:hypothetical protein [Robertkochia aurantiaca]|uniref:hypothetical protein n=1 Tax=Robertkochia aurantiaca TaxID=2873700 RepID=UPI001CCF4A19|nr:hypothetical protein [Robertkochia sp. 3YJGBD-33]